MCFGRLEAFNSINTVTCGQGKAKFLKQEARTWRAERDNFDPLPLKKCQWIRQATSIPINIVTLTIVDFFKSNISTNISEIQLEVHT